MPRVHIGGLGQDDFSYDIGGSGSSPFVIGSSSPSYDIGDQVLTGDTGITSGSPVGPPLPSGAFTTATATPSDVAWAQQNAQFESTSFAPSGVTSYGTSSPTANPFAQSAASIAAAIAAPSPRISTAQVSASTPLLTGSSLISGLPNIVVIGGAAILLVAIISAGGRRR